ncbi:MAG: hypothetical protein WCK10_02400 [Candidatus Staskawiczbacteria bacterium]
MKKIFLPILFFCLLAIIFMPFFANAAIVECQNDCTMQNLLGLFDKILSFIVNTLAVPLGGISITIGAILMMISAGNPNIMGLGKKIFWSAVIGLFLALGTQAIVDFILNAVGYKK